MAKEAILSDISGLAVITQDEGAHLGFVMQVFVDPVARRISRLAFHQNPVTTDYWIPADQIVSIGRDVVAIRTETAAKRLGVDEAPEDMALQAVLGLWLTTSDGNHLGTVVDLAVDAKNWSVCELHLGGGQKLAVKAEDVVLGRDEILIPTEYAEKVAELHGSVAQSDLGHLFGRLLRSPSLEHASRTIRQTFTHAPTARAIARAAKRQRQEIELGAGSKPTQKDKRPRSKKSVSPAKASTEQETHA